MRIIRKETPSIVIVSLQRFLSTTNRQSNYYQDMPVPASGMIAHLFLHGAALSGAFMDLDVDRVAGDAFPMVFAVNS